MQFVCSNLSPSVARLCLASCGMSVTGAEAVAKMLRSVMVARVGDMKSSTVYAAKIRAKLLFI